jgi:antitoxin ParD1/3/4
LKKIFFEDLSDNNDKKLVILQKKDIIMLENTSLRLGDYYENFVHQQIETKKYTSVDDVLRSALRLLENEEHKVNSLVNALIVGEKSGMIENFNSQENLQKLHAKYLK